jgi:hypothetical protein
MNTDGIETGQTGKGVPCARRGFEGEHIILPLCFDRPVQIIRAAMENTTRPAENKPRHVWPWFVAAAVIVAVVLAVAAIRAEAIRVKQQRQFSIPETAK